MAIELPSEVALFLNFIGVPYPDINEEDVRALAQYVRDFAEGVAGTHDLATGAIDDMGSVYSGESYQQLVAAWARMSTSHMADLDQACHVVAGALNVAADVITAVKAAVVTELAALAASYAVVLATPGAGPYALAVREIARRLCQGMEEMLLTYFAAEVIEKAIEPLEETIDRLVNGVVRDTVRDALGVPAPGQGAVTPLYIEPDEVLRYAKVLDDLADDILEHAATFAENVAGLDFTTSDQVGIESDPVVAQPGKVSAGSIEAPPLDLRTNVLGRTAELNSLSDNASSSLPEAEVSPRDEGRRLPPEPRLDHLQSAGEHGAPAMPADSIGTGEQLANKPEIGSSAQETGVTPGESSAVRAGITEMSDRFHVAASSSSAAASLGLNAVTPDDGRRGVGAAIDGIGVLDGLYSGRGLVPDVAIAGASPQRTDVDSVASPSPWARSGQVLPREKAASKRVVPEPPKTSATVAAAAEKRLQTPWSSKKRDRTVRKVFAPTNVDAIGTTSLADLTPEKNAARRDGKHESSPAVSASDSVSPSSH